MGGPGPLYHPVCVRTRSPALCAILCVRQDHFPRRPPPSSVRADTLKNSRGRVDQFLAIGAVFDGARAYLNKLEFTEQPVSKT